MAKGIDRRVVAGVRKVASGLPAKRDRELVERLAIFADAVLNAQQGSAPALPEPQPQPMRKKPPRSLALMDQEAKRGRR